MLILAPTIVWELLHAAIEAYLVEAEAVMMECVGGGEVALRDSFHCGCRPFHGIEGSKLRDLPSVRQRLLRRILLG